MTSGGPPADGAVATTGSTVAVKGIASSTGLTTNYGGYFEAYAEPLEEVPLDEALSEVEEDNADVEEIEVAPPEESEEELSMRMSAISESVDWGDLPSIEAVEESAEAEELSVDAPEESEEEVV